MASSFHPSLDEHFAARVTRALRVGSRAALTEIYDAFASDIVRNVRQTTKRDESFAMDCLQETFMRLASNPPLCENNAQLAAWLQVTALNVARNAIVADGRRVRREMSHQSLSDARTSTPTLDEEQQSILNTLDRSLTDAERELLRFRIAEGLSIHAIGRALGFHPRRIESALRRIVARLRAERSEP